MSLFSQTVHRPFVYRTKLNGTVFPKAKRVLQPDAAIKLCSQPFQSYFTYSTNLDQHKEQLLGELCLLKTASCVSHFVCFAFFFSSNSFNTHSFGCPFMNPGLMLIPESLLLFQLLNLQQNTVIWELCSTLNNTENLLR